MVTQLLHTWILISSIQKALTCNKSLTSSEKKKKSQYFLESLAKLSVWNNEEDGGQDVIVLFWWKIFFFPLSLLIKIYTILGEIYIDQYAKKNKKERERELSVFISIWISILLWAHVVFPIYTRESCDKDLDRFEQWAQEKLTNLKTRASS